MKRTAALAAVVATIVGACTTGTGTDSDVESSPSTTTASTTTTSTETTTTSRATTTTTSGTATTLLTPDSSACTLLQAATWLLSDVGSVPELNSSDEAIGAIIFAVNDTGGSEDELYEKTGAVEIGAFLLAQLKNTTAWSQSRDSVDQVAIERCSTSLLSSITVDETMDVPPLAQVFAGRFELNGRAITAEERAELEAQLDPDGDGLYYVHTSRGDSETFWVPSRFRVTYTGTGQTCAVYVMDAATGDELEWISNLDGGGFARVFLDSAYQEVYLGDIIGCRNGTLEVGPDS